MDQFDPLYKLAEELLDKLSGHAPPEMEEARRKMLASLLSDQRESRLLEVIASLIKESDRGLVVVGAAYFDDQLKSILSAYFIDDEQLRTELLREGGPIGPFSCRINLTYALGLISEPLYKDLHTVRKIRNKFAHRPLISLNDQSIHDLCMNLKREARQHEVEDVREHFIGAFARIAAELAVARVLVQRVEPLPPYEPAGLQAVLQRLGEQINETSNP